MLSPVSPALPSYLPTSKVLSAKVQSLCLSPVSTAPAGGSDYLTSTKVYNFKRRELLPFDDGTIWQIVSGYVRIITWAENGDVMTLGIWGAGDIIGQPLSRVNPYQIDCLTPVQLVVCSGSVEQIAPMLLHHIQEVEQLLSLCQVRPINDRLRQILMWLADRFGQENPQGRTTGIALTHQQLADLAGTTRVTVTRLLNDFQQTGFIAKLPRQEIILRSVG